MTPNRPPAPPLRSPRRRALLRPVAAGLLALPLTAWRARAQTATPAEAPPAPPAPPATGASDVAAPVPPLTPPPPAVPATWAPLLAQRLKDQPGAVGLVALQADAAGIAVLAAGAQRAGEPQPLDAGARFEIGSISKTFTALLLADAVVRGELSLDGAVEEALQRPGEPPLKLRDRDGLPLRWRDLATHRAGLPRLPANLAPVSASDPYFGFDDARLREALRAWQPERARDAAYVYSNFGYGLLGHALVQVLAPVEVPPVGTGADALRFEALLRRRILDPLGLSGARVAVAGRGADPTPGHDGRARPVPPWTFEALAGAGALVMDAATLGRYAQAALGLGPFADHPLRPAFALALRRHGDGPAPINPVGLGWLLAPLNGRTVFNHDGGTGGFSTSLWLDPSRGRATALLSNAQVETADLALHLLDPVVPPKDFSLTRQAVATVSAERLAPLAGTYRLNPQFALEVTPRGAELWARATGQGTFQLFPRSARRFFARVTPLEIEFEGDDGVPAALVLLQGGQKLRFVREP